MKLKDVLLNVLNEDKDSTESEYLRIFDKYFTDPTLLGMTKQSDDALERMGIKMIIKKTDSDNVILKYGIDERDKIIYLVGLLSEEKRLKMDDVKDFEKWISILNKKLDQGYKLITSPNKYSQKIIKHIMYKNPDIKKEINGEEMSFNGDKDLNTFETVILYK